MELRSSGVVMGGWIRKRRGTRALLVVVISLVAAVTSVAPAGAAQPTAVTATMTPATDLVDNTVVTVTGHGFQPGRWVGAAQCAGAEPAVDLERCLERGAVGGLTDANGDITLRLVLDAELYLPFLGGRAPVDCRTRTCSIWIADLVDLGQAARLPLPFVPGSPTLPGELTLTPAEGLVDAQQVTITGRLFPGRGSVSVRQCVTVGSGPPRCSSGRGQRIPILPDGTFSLPFRVDAMLPVDRGETVDCRTEATCEIRVDDAFDEVTEPDAVHPLAFDADGPLAGPFPTTVTPTTDLVDGQQVAVMVSGLDARESVSIVQCATSDPAEERCDQVGGGLADAQGRVSRTVPVRVGLGPPEEPFDCRSGSVPGASPCVLRIGPGGDVYDSRRTAVVDLHFDPESPGPPPPPTPVVTVDPATGLGDFQAVDVTVTNLVPQRTVEVAVCAADDGGPCDRPAVQGTGGTAIEQQLAVTPVFEATDGTVVDCRAAPGCRITARARGLVGHSDALGFAPQESERYLDAVFTDVTVTRDVVYRQTVDRQGAPVDLALDLYEPAGDTATDRPVVVWLPGGWFRSVDRAAETEARVARNLARRGYVVAVMDYRTLGEPGTGFPDFATSVAAAVDAYDDVTAGIGWLTERAGELGIDPDRVVAAGSDAGGVTAFNLAYVPGQRGPATSLVAAAVPLSGLSLGVAEPGEPPVLAFHGVHDQDIDVGAVQQNCENAQAVGLVCDLRIVLGGPQALLPTNEHWIVHLAIRFLGPVLRIMAHASTAR